MSRAMDKETFEKEVGMCRELSKKNGGRCAWGECAKCGVIPLLYKIGKGEFYDDDKDVKRIKNEALN